MSTRPKYSRIGQEDDSGAALSMNEDTQDIQNGKIKLSREQRRKNRAERAEWYSTKLHALMWTVAALVSLYFSDIINVCINSEKVNRFWFNAGVVCFTIAAVLVLYMAVWVPRVMKIQYDPQVYSPRMLPVTGGFSLLCGLFFIIGLWPVYGFFTPGLLFVLWLGGLMSSHFLPAI